MKSPYRDRKYEPRTTTYDTLVGFFQNLALSIPLHVCKDAIPTLAGPAWGPYGSYRIWKTLDIPVRGLYHARTGIAQGPCGVLQII